MEFISFAVRCILVVLYSWIGVRIIGRRSIAQMTSYDFVALMIIANVAAEPLVYKVASKSFLGTIIIASVAMVIGYMSLKKRFYNFDMRPDILVVNGKVDKDALRRNRMNLPFLLSLLRIQGHTNVSDVEFAILEPNGNLSVVPKSQRRPVTPKDLKIETEYEGIPLPLVIDGEIQYNNLKYAKLNLDWLNQETRKLGVKKIEGIFLAELKTTGELSIDLYSDALKEPPII